MKTRIYVGAITIVSLFLRLFHLGTPKGFVFDEVYYVDGARDYLAHGVEVTGNGPEFVVHPPVGKWLIATGIKIFGDNEFGWRFMGALLGSVMIILIALIAHRLFRNTYLTIAASALMAMDYKLGTIAGYFNAMCQIIARTIYVINLMVWLVYI